MNHEPRTPETEPRASPILAALPPGLLTESPPFQRCAPLWERRGHATLRLGAGFEERPPAEGELALSWLSAKLGVRYDTATMVVDNLETLDEVNGILPLGDPQIVSFVLAKDFHEHEAGVPLTLGGITLLSPALARIARRFSLSGGEWLDLERDLALSRIAPDVATLAGLLDGAKCPWREAWERWRASLAEDAAGDSQDPPNDAEYRRVLDRLVSALSRSAAQLRLDAARQWERYMNAVRPGGASQMSAKPWPAADRRRLRALCLSAYRAHERPEDHLIVVAP